MIMFKNVTAEGVGVVFAALPTIPIGAPRHEYVSVPGRDGSLTIADDSLEDVVIALEGHCIGKDRKILTSWLSGSGELVFDHMPDRYLDARVTEETSVESVKDDLMKFNVFFRCKPYFKLFSGQTVVAVQGKSITLINQGTLPALPKVKIMGSGDLTIKQSGKIIMTVKSVSGYVEIDSEADIVHKGTASMSTLATGEVPVLGLGQTTLTVEGSVTDIEVKPNWRVR